MTFSDSRSGTGSAQNEQVKKVLLWRESLARLPDNHFFELVRMYLGEVKTPYNKQKLIESLGAFLHRAENKRNLASLLSAGDMQIVSAVFFIPNASQEKLSDFFAGTCTFAELYERLLNLEERLILFRYTDPLSGHTVFGTNPLLDDILRPLAGIRHLLPAPGHYTQVFTDEPVLSQQLLAALLSFTAADSDLCKLDGSFKKRAAQHLAEVFPWMKESKNVLFFRTIITALKNLSVLRQSGKILKPDFRRTAVFAALPESSQYAYIAAAACGHCSYSELQRRAQYVLDFLASIPAEGFTRRILERAEFLVKHRGKENAPAAGLGKSRFARMLERSAASQISAESADSPEEDLDAENPSVLSLTESVIRLGLLRYAGSVSDVKAPAEEFVYVPFLSAETAAADDPRRRLPEQKVLTIDAGFSVTMMPGLSLDRMIPLVRCMDIVRFDTVSVFEITKQSCLRAFDDGLEPADIIAAFSPFLPYQLPQNLVVSIEDWAHAYNSAALYKGYILHITDGSKLIENNPVIAPYIRKTLAPGLFLLDFADDAEASEIITQSGLDSIGSVKTASAQTFVAPFMSLSKGRTDFQQTGTAVPAEPSIRENLHGDEGRSAFFDSMRAELDKLDLPRDQADGLLFRIERKIVLNPQQLRGDSVKSEKIEAGGMDFLGKIHVAEHAITTGSMLELVFQNSADESNRMIVGMPLSVEKKQGDALIRIRVEPTQTVETRSLGQASFVRRLRGAIFREV